MTIYGLLENCTAGMIYEDHNVSYDSGSILKNLNIDGPVAFGKRCVVTRCNVGRYSATGNDLRASDCEIGAFCSFGDNILLGAGTHPKNWLTTHLFKVNPKFWEWADVPVSTKNELNFTWRQPSIIGNDVWIAANVVVLSGLTIGDGVIIGANSVVRTDLPPYSIAVGSPARVTGFRFEPQLIARIQASQWWTLPLQFLVDLPLDDMEACLVRIEKFQTNERAAR